MKAPSHIILNALRISTAMNLPLGRTYLRSGVRDRRTGRIGTMEIPLNMPTADQHEPQAPLQDFTRPSERRIAKLRSQGTSFG